MKRCGCLFSCQFLLETFPVRRKLEEEVKEHARAEIWSSSLTLIWTPGAAGQVYNLPGATVMMVPPPLLWAVRSLSEVSVLYHPSAEACSSGGLHQDSAGLWTSTTSSKAASEQKRKDLLDLGDGPRGISAAWRGVRMNANSPSKTGSCCRNSCRAPSLTLQTSPHREEPHTSFNSYEIGQFIDHMYVGG